VYQERRYTGDCVTVQQVISEGLLGRVVTFEHHFDRYRPELKAGAWREQDLPGSGVWYDLGPHLLDYSLQLFGPPDAISADIRIDRDAAVVDDAFDVTLHYPRMRAILRGSMLAAGSAPTFVVHGTKGSFIKYGQDPQEGALKAGQTPDAPDWDREAPEFHGTLTTREGTRVVPTVPSNFTRYYENIRDVILGKAPLAVTPAQALDVMRGLLGAVVSSKRGSRVDWS
jgi:scyllo-inositol 2-dehydrogenase (NADP+)